MIFAAILTGALRMPPPPPGRARLVSWDRPEKASNAGLASESMTAYLTAQQQKGVESRNRILAIVRQKPRTAADVMKETGLSESCVKRHLRDLKGLDLLTSRRVGMEHFWEDAHAPTP